MLLCGLIRGIAEQEVSISKQRQGTQCALTVAIGEEADEVVEQRAGGGWEERAAGCQGNGRAHPALRHFLYHHLKMADLCHTVFNTLQNGVT